MTVNEEVIYSNSSQCKKGSFSPEQIIELISESIGEKPKWENKFNPSDGPDTAPVCPLPGQKLQENGMALPVINSNESDCGCKPINPSLATETVCCGSKDVKLDEKNLNSDTILR